MQVLFFQTAEANYRPLLELTSQTVREYCTRHQCSYESYFGIIRGYYPWQATYNRIPMLQRMLDSGYDGWVCYLDADALISDLDFDLRAYLADKQDYALIAAPGKDDGPWWDVNAGVFLLNLAHPMGKLIVRRWSAQFASLSDEDLKAGVEWHQIANDQGMLHMLLQGIENARAHVLVTGERPWLLNGLEGRFIRQVMRSRGGMPERVAMIAKAVRRVMGDQAAVLPNVEGSAWNASTAPAGPAAPAVRATAEQLAAAEYAVRHVATQYPDVPLREIRARLRLATFVNPERGYMYYEVPKAGCTSIKTLIHRLEDLPDITFAPPEARRDMFVHNRDQFKMPSLLDLTDAEQEHMLTSDTVFRFTAVRNPYTRIESAWRDKVRQCAPGFESFYQAIRGTVPAPFTPESLIEFREFLDVIKLQDLSVCNPHWRRQTQYAFLNAMNFTTVGRLEKLDETIREFLDRAGFDTGEAGARRMNATVAAGSYDEATAALVYELYRADFDAFGYEKDSWRAGRDKESVSEARLSAEIAERNVVIGQLYARRSGELRQLAAERARVRKLEEDLRAAEAMPRDAEGADAMAREFVDALYRCLLLRQPDAKALDRYVSLIGEGRPLARIMREILASQEFAGNQERFQQTYTRPQVQPA